MSAAFRRWCSCCFSSREKKPKQQDDIETPIHDAAMQILTPEALEILRSSPHYQSQVSAMARSLLERHITAHASEGLMLAESSSKFLEVMKDKILSLDQVPSFDALCQIIEQGPTPENREAASDLCSEITQIIIADCIAQSRQTEEEDVATPTTEDAAAEDAAAEDATAEDPAAEDAAEDAGLREQRAEESQTSSDSSEDTISEETTSVHVEPQDVEDLHRGD